MKRRRFIAAFSAATVAGVPLCAARAAFAQAGGEPTYTATFADKATLKLQVKVARNGDGGQTVVVQSRPASVAPATLWINSSLTASRDGTVQTTRAAFGPVPNVGLLLEAKRLPMAVGEGAYKVGVPATQGTASFTGTLWTPMVAELFAGKMYDWKKGGAQNFAMIVDLGAVLDVRIVTLTLTAPDNGKTEPLKLADGDVPARKLHASANLSFLPEAMGAKVETDFWVGPGGEVLKCDTPFFGIPIQAKNKAVWENNGNRWALYFNNPGDAPVIPIPRVLLRADKQNAKWEIGLDIGEARSAQTIVSAGCDLNYRLTHMENPWRGRPTRVTAVGNELRWSIDAEPGQVVPTPTSGQTWWLPSWFVTTLWEGPEMPFAGMEPNGEKKSGDYFPLFTGQRDANPFTLERLPDAGTTGGSQNAPIRHYRFVAKNVYDVYTDGARLIAFLGSDKTLITRDGWENWAKVLPFPDAPAPVIKLVTP